MCYNNHTYRAAVKAKGEVRNMTTQTAALTKTYPEIAAEYAPYHTMTAFAKGTSAYMNRVFDNPYSIEQGVKAQAWDRGLEAAMRFTRQHGGF
jgi:hypothetical protein